jgi:hypothetical protein
MDMELDLKITECVFDARLKGGSPNLRALAQKTESLSMVRLHANKKRAPARAIFRYQKIILTGALLRLNYLFTISLPPAISPVESWFQFAS